MGGDPYRATDAESLRLTCNSHGLAQTFTLTATHLVHEWSGSDTGRKDYPLAHLAPEPSIVAGKEPAPDGAQRRGLLCVGLAAVAHFSVLRDSVPLLSLFFVVVGVYELQRHYRAGRRLEYLAIAKKDGEATIFIDRNGCDAKQLETFEHGFGKRVRAVASAQPD